MTTMIGEAAAAVAAAAEEEKRDGQFDIWAAIQQAKEEAPAETGPPYVHPLLKRSASFLSQKSLEVCTESLGSETGCDGFSDGLASLSDSDSEAEDCFEPLEEADEAAEKRKELAAVNYHCSGNTKSPARSFPPPLPSISRRDGPCLHMRPRRRDGRLVMHAVPVPSQNYLHCQRRGGRLLLSFIETAFEEIYPDGGGAEELEPSPIEENEEEEEEEVVDRGITVEVKVEGIEKTSMVSLTAVQETEARRCGRKEAAEEPESSGLLFSSKKMMTKRQDLLTRCSSHDEHYCPLFVWEPSCIATS